MKIRTTQFGELEMPENRIITFEKGIPGFEEYKEYVLLPADEQGESPFFFLQSIEMEEVSFFLVDPFSFFKDYDVKLEEKMLERLAIEEPTDVIVLTTVSVTGEMKDATTNLKGPIIINNVKKLGMQVVLNNKTYQIKQPLFQTAEARQV
ncbi:flagellar assembly protein FliW [Planomicrobium sp. CPCC 101079]|uniref:flagellar assembly protein FliW n=1 Tax=Planomicrobium sp. CPCC 101079 TaxID=2599618 RepID=UPI0011B8575D|nr:flagellar assembly protein FliW [Planomicrobium sp. CPCC 101079]TWT03665.1 flagellar assembly protein FliW [Planomicrobium sp. CPCC 101079]